MDQRHRDTVQKNETFLLQNLSMKPLFLAHLVSQFIIDFDEEEYLIKNDLTTAAKIRHFCRLIIRKGPEAFEGFMQALVDTGQGFIREKLEEDLLTCAMSGLRVDPRKTIKGETAKKTGDNSEDKIEETIWLRVSDVELLADFISFTPRDDGLTAAQAAINKGNVSLLSFCCTVGADMNDVDIEKQNLLHRAARVGHLDTVDGLLHRADMLSVNSLDKDNRTPLHVSIMSGNPSASRRLIEKFQADITLVDSYNRDPLFLACQFGDLETAQILLDRGAVYTTKTSLGNTALDIASCFGFTDIVRLLLDRGADVSVRRDDGVTPLHVACQEGHRAVAELLLSRGAPVDARKSTDATPLHVACENGHTAVAELLLSVGAQVDARKVTDGATPLFKATQYGYSDVVGLLLAWGAEVDGRAAGLNDSTPLHTACYSGHLCVVQVLLGKGAHINAQNKKAYTPLHYACHKGHTQIVQELLQHPTLNTHIVNNKNKTARQLAEACGHKEILELLPAK